MGLDAIFVCMERIEDRPSHRSDPGSRTVTFSSTAHRPGSLVAMDGACLMVTYDLIMRSASLHFAEPSYAIYSPLI